MPKKSQKKRVARVGNQSEISATALAYTGPVRTLASNQQVDLHTVVCSYTNAAFGSSAAGVIQPSYGDDPSLVGDWASLVAVYEEYRTLAFEVAYYPNNRYAPGTTFRTPIAVVPDRASAAILGSYAVAAEHASCKIFTLDDPWRVKMNMQDVTESQFIATSTPTPTKWIKLFSNGLSLSTTYGMVIITYRIQFRGKA